MQPAADRCLSDWGGGNIVHAPAAGREPHMPDNIWLNVAGWPPAPRLRRCRIRLCCALSWAPCPPEASGCEMPMHSAFSMKCAASCTRPPSSQFLATEWYIMPLSGTPAASCEIQGCRVDSGRRGHRLQGAAGVHTLKESWRLGSDWIGLQAEPDQTTQHTTVPRLPRRRTRTWMLD